MPGSLEKAWVVCGSEYANRWNLNITVRNASLYAMLLCMLPYMLESSHLQRDFLSL